MIERPKDLNTASPWNMRIWDDDNGQWLNQNDPNGVPYYGFDIRGGETTVFQGLDWVYKQFSAGHKLVWERSTGLVGKDGVEIYEHDTLHRKGETGIVYWNKEKASFYVRWISGGEDTPLANVITPSYYVDSPHGDENAEEIYKTYMEDVE